jgi:hypothetical protein
MVQINPFVIGFCDVKVMAGSFHVCEFDVIRRLISNLIEFFRYTIKIFFSFEIRYTIS